MAKKIELSFISIILLFVFLLPISAGATPQLGVIDTDLLGTVSGTVPVGMDGFYFPSDGRITVWWGNETGATDKNAHVWIATDAGPGRTFSVGGDYIFA